MRVCRSRPSVTECHRQMKNLQSISDSEVRSDAVASLELSRGFESLSLRAQNPNQCHPSVTSPSIFLEFTKNPVLPAWWGWPSRIEDVSRAVSRLHSKISVTDRGCWEWRGRRNKGGYGVITVTGVRFITSRLSFILFAGPLPEGWCACHRCDNPCCINPDHLFAGTKKDNNLDAFAKGRRTPAKMEERRLRNLAKMNARYASDEEYRLATRRRSLERYRRTKKILGAPAKSADTSGILPYQPHVAGTVGISLPKPEAPTL